MKKEKNIKCITGKYDFGIIKCTFYLYQKTICVQCTYQNGKSKKFNGFLITHDGNLKQVWIAIFAQVARLTFDEYA